MSLLRHGGGLPTSSAAATAAPRKCARVPFVAARRARYEGVSFPTVTTSSITDRSRCPNEARPIP